MGLYTYTLTVTPLKKINFLYFLMILSQTPSKVVHTSTMHLNRGDSTLEWGCQEHTVEGRRGGRPVLRPRVRLSAHHEGLRAESGSRCVITARKLFTTIPTTPPSRLVSEKSQQREFHWIILTWGTGGLLSILIYFTLECRGVGGKSRFLYLF